MTGVALPRSRLTCSNPWRHRGDRQDPFGDGAVLATQVGRRVARERDAGAPESWPGGFAGRHPVRMPPGSRPRSRRCGATRDRQPARDVARTAAGRDRKRRRSLTRADRCQAAGRSPAPGRRAYGSVKTQIPPRHGRSAKQRTTPSQGSPGEGLMAQRCRFGWHSARSMHSGSAPGRQGSPRAGRR